MDLSSHLPSLVIDPNKRKRVSPNVNPAMLRLFLTVEIVDLEAPLFLLFELVSNCFDKAAEFAIGREVFYYLVGRGRMQYFLGKLGCGERVRVGLVPLLADSDGKE